ncbi:MAG TPA: hypothetical protein PLO37_10140 [Candidatus Hydrogenedentes bacterium]|mgnify:CR=1 FL=1|nr:hypothetical protein [Candidatus Hydrogenedentota bacterium]HPG67193.1 hypothetical protein [Candidatus Hydrogenedentota bacterium]
MKRNARKLTIIVGMCLILVATETAAWGPRAQKAIPVAAIQMIRRTFPSAFKTERNNYEEDVLRGATAGPEILKNSVPLTCDAEAVSAVGTETQLLRAVSPYGMGSYFAYRMGVLGALVANVVLPYGLSWTPEDITLQAKINADLDGACERYRFEPASDTRLYVRDPNVYFAQHRRFYNEDKKMIRDDYTVGNGPAGFLREGGQAYFGRAIEAISDVWYTVLRTQGDPADVPPSAPVIARYFVNEIAYLLNEKRNIHQADKSYEHFVAANPGMAELYEQVGDLYYAYGTDEGRDRGVREWRIAYGMGGVSRRTSASKLSSHFLRVGQAFLDAASAAGATDRDLPNALEAFTQALEFDRGSETAAKRLNETNVAIMAREERRQLAISVIASAEKVVKEADKGRMDKSFEAAIATYKKAISLFETIDEEFSDQSSTAKQAVKAINLSITEVINDVLDTASETISKGLSLIDEKKFEEAEAEFVKVPEIVKIIPDDDSIHARNKKEVIEEAQRRVGEAKEAKERYEAAKRANEEAARAAAAAAGGTPNK